MTRQMHKGCKGRLWKVNHYMEMLYGLRLISSLVHGGIGAGRTRE